MCLLLLGGVVHYVGEQVDSCVVCHLGPFPLGLPVTERGIFKHLLTIFVLLSISSDILKFLPHIFCSSVIRCAKI